MTDQYLFEKVVPMAIRDLPIEQFLSVIMDSCLEMAREHRYTPGVVLVDRRSRTHVEISYRSLEKLQANALPAPDVERMMAITVDYINQTQVGHPELGFPIVVQTDEVYEMLFVIPDETHLSQPSLKKPMMVQ